MPAPVPTPTADELETVAEIAEVQTSSVLALISNYEQSIANAKWARALADIDLWPDIRDFDNTKKIGSIEFYDPAKSWELNKLEFRNTMRRRYGLPILTLDTISQGSSGGFVHGGAAVTVTSDW